MMNDSFAEVERSNKTMRRTMKPIPMAQGQEYYPPYAFQRQD